MEPNTSQKIPGNLIHIVFFWLKNPENTADRNAFEKAIQKLIQDNSQGVAAHLGTPAATEKREVVDNSFTYCYIMTFDSIATEQAYQTAPTHLAFVEEVGHLWKKVVVHDSLSIQP